MKYLFVIGAIVIGLLVLRMVLVPEGPEKASFDGTTFTLERADTDASRALGLGKRDSLCDTCGMLFVFDAPGNQGFWMKDMRFPLDIIWLMDDQVVHVERRVSPDSKEVYRPSVVANQVLEVGAGMADTLEVGERVVFSSR
jgi:uncharacterized membrane protein (UPF0127 family)